MKTSVTRKLEPHHPEPQEPKSPPVPLESLEDIAWELWLLIELLAPVRLNNVCFTLKGKDKQEIVPDFLTALNNTGKVFMTPTVYNGRKGIRASFVNWRTTETDIELVIQEIKKLKQ